jgi:hypothetical protein
LPAGRGLIFTVHRKGTVSDLIAIFADGQQRMLLELPGELLGGSKQQVVRLRDLRRYGATAFAVIMSEGWLLGLGSHSNQQPSS